MDISIPVSAGELCDKFTILNIKWDNIHDTVKRQSIKDELFHIYPLVQVLIEKYPHLNDLCTKLLDVNRILWNMEDKIRELSAAKDYGTMFIAIAQDIHRSNDVRAKIKQEINATTNSPIMEVKGYA